MVPNDIDTQRLKPGLRDRTRRIAIPKTHMQRIADVQQQTETTSFEPTRSGRRRVIIEGHAA